MATCRLIWLAMFLPFVAGRIPASAIVETATAAAEELEVACMGGPVACGAAVILIGGAVEIVEIVQVYKWWHERMHEAAVQKRKICHKHLPDLRVDFHEMVNRFEQIGTLVAKWKPLIAAKRYGDLCIEAYNIFRIGHVFIESARDALHDAKHLPTSCPRANAIHKRLLECRNEMSLGLHFVIDLRHCIPKGVPVCTDQELSLQTNNIKASFHTIKIDLNRLAHLLSLPRLNMTHQRHDSDSLTPMSQDLTNFGEIGTLLLGLPRLNTTHQSLSHSTVHNLTNFGEVGTPVDAETELILYEDYFGDFASRYKNLASTMQDDSVDSWCAAGKSYIEWPYAAAVILTALVLAALIKGFVQRASYNGEDTYTKMEAHQEEGCAQGATHNGEDPYKKMEAHLEEFQARCRASCTRVLTSYKSISLAVLALFIVVSAVTHFGIGNVRVHCAPHATNSKYASSLALSAESLEDNLASQLMCIDLASCSDEESVSMQKQLRSMVQNDFTYQPLLKSHASEVGTFIESGGECYDKGQGCTSEERVRIQMRLLEAVKHVYEQIAL